ncbi:hypothetical protein FHG87_010720 [Trinorchestia longiramus]|nr:hypothetical protein FHG87_010720 [Trinorchestia longiramus]
MVSKETRPQSLGLSIWSILETRILPTSHSSLVLKAELQREWEAIPQKQIRAACDAFVNRLKAVINTNSLKQQVNEPTRQNDILDLVMTTPDLIIIGLKVTDKIGDHHIIDYAVEVHDQNTRTQQKQVLDYKWANLEPMKATLTTKYS